MICEFWFLWPLSWKKAVCRVDVKWAEKVWWTRRRLCHRCRRRSCKIDASERGRGIGQMCRMTTDIVIDNYKSWKIGRVIVGKVGEWSWLICRCREVLFWHSPGISDNGFTQCAEGVLEEGSEKREVIVVIAEEVVSLGVAGFPIGKSCSTWSMECTLKKQKLYFYRKSEKRKLQNVWGRWLDC